MCSYKNDALLFCTESCGVTVTQKNGFCLNLTEAIEYILIHMEFVKAQVYSMLKYKKMKYARFEFKKYLKSRLTSEKLYFYRINS